MRRGPSDPDTYVRGFGGDTSNMAIAAARLGARARYVSRVGDDAFGRSLLRLWADEGVDTRGVTTDAAAPTGVYFVTHGPAGHEFSYLRTGSAASRLEPSTLPEDVIRGAQCAARIRASARRSAEAHATPCSRPSTRRRRRERASRTIRICG